MKGIRGMRWQSSGQSRWQYFMRLLLSLLCMAGAGAAHAADSFDGTYLHIPLVVVNGTTFSNVVVTLGSVVGVTGGAPVASYDSYDGATGHLSIPSVLVGSTVYTNVVITLGGVNGVGGSSTASPVITSIDNSSPTPLTVLHIATSGLIPNAPAFVTFSDGAKYSVTVPAVRVAADGTVVVGTPFYLNGTTGAIGPGTVTAAVRQGANISQPVTLSIQDLPALSTYGTPVGAITKSFLSFEANLHAIRMNEFQAVQPLLGGSTDTSQAQTALGTMLGAAITSRNSVDNIVQNGAYVEPMTVLPDGTSLQLDQNQLMLMDRIIGAYLTQQFSAGVTSGSLVIKAALRRKSGTVQPVVKTTASTLVSTLNTFLASVNGSLSARAWALGQTDGSDAGLAAADAAASLSGLDENQWVGGFLSLAHINAALESTFHAVSAGAVCMGAASCTDTSAIQAELNSGSRDFVSTYVQAIAATSASTRFAGSLVNLADQLAAAYRNMQNLYSNGSFKAASATDNMLASGSYLLGSASGAITQPSTSGVAVPQSYLNFCCFGSSSGGVAGLVDPSGNYSLLMPLNAAGTNYSAITMNVVDIASGSTLDTQTVDLSGLNSQTPVQIPAASYCSNGATDYPTCTPPTCANGATDYPICTPPPTNACNFCSFDVYCTVYGPGGCWRCSNSTYSASGVCLGSTSISLVSPGACVTDPSMYTICQ